MELGQIKLMYRARIKSLQNPEDERFRFELEQIDKMKSDIASRESMIGWWRRVGVGAKGKIKPTYAKAIAQAEEEIRGLKLAIGIA